MSTLCDGTCHFRLLNTDIPPVAEYEQLDNQRTKSRMTELPQPNIAKRSTQFAADLRCSSCNDFKTNTRLANIIETFKEKPVTVLQT
jgi:hypothetical protein